MSKKEYWRFFLNDWTIKGLILLCVVIFISHTLYVLKTYQYPEWDEHHYLYKAIHYYEILKYPTWGSWAKILRVMPDRQPLYPITITLPLLVFGTYYTYKIALEINVFYYIITIISIYFLAKEFLSRKASFMAALMYSFYGFPLFYLHFTYSETAATAFVALSFLLLVKTKLFTNTRYTILFSGALALGSLVRWVVPLFILGSFAYVVLTSVFKQFMQKGRRIRKYLLNLAIFVVLGAVVPILLFYNPNYTEFMIQVRGKMRWGPYWMANIRGVDLPGIENPFSVHSIMYYLNIFSQQTIFFWLVFVVGFLLSIIFVRKYAYFLLGFIAPYLKPRASARRRQLLPESSERVQWKHEIYQTATLCVLLRLPYIHITCQKWTFMKQFDTVN